MTVVPCPNCEAPLELPADDVGVTIECPDCGELWRIAENPPPLLVYAQETEEEPPPEVGEGRF